MPADGGDAHVEGGGDEQGPGLAVAVTHGSQTFTVHVPPGATVADLALLCEEELRERAAAAAAGRDENSSAETYGYTVSKLIGQPPVGLINVAKDGDAAVRALVQRRLGHTLPPEASPADDAAPVLKLLAMASRTSAVAALREGGEHARQQEARYAALRQRQRRAAKTTPATAAAAAAADPTNGGFTFAQVRPLAHLPAPAQSLAYLERLRDDAGVRHVMRAHRFRVGLLTEMDPATNTHMDHDGTTRLLGLNRNRGQVVELRLRTDAGDGYRDYRTVRRTLCHELAHNVHGPHDSHFWALYRQLERECEAAAAAADGRIHGGRSLAGLAEADYYTPDRHGSSGGGDDDDYDVHVDAGGWTGGTFVLGSGTTPASVPADVAAAAGAAGAAAPSSTTTTAAGSRSSSTLEAQREARARAAEQRLRRMMGGGSSGSGSGANQ